MIPRHYEQLADKHIFRWTSEAEADAIRLEQDRRKERALAMEMLADISRQEEKRRKSSIVAWLVGSALVGFLVLLALLVWSAT